MIIRELTLAASVALLSRAHLGRLACTRANQPYVIPIFFAYHEHNLYVATTLGQKIEWMRENPLVAVQVDEIDSAEQWATVIAFGRYEELADTPGMRDLRRLAWSLLQTANPLWWEPGYARTVLSGAERPMAPLYFRIRIGQITGHSAASQ